MLGEKIGEFAFKKVPTVLDTWSQYSDMPITAARGGS